MDSKPDAVKPAGERWADALNKCPCVAILRGVEPAHAVPVGQALVDAGFSVIEVPLNSPDALQSIKLLASALPESIVVGAGTVLTVDQVDAVAAVGGVLVVSPNLDEEVVRRTKALELVSVPGVNTPSEAFRALATGADCLKAFPGEQLPPKVIKAWSAVLPKDAMVVPTGGITPENMAAYWEAGARGFGIGSNIFKPGDSAESVKAKAETFVAAAKSLTVAESPLKRSRLS